MTDTFDNLLAPNSLRERLQRDLAELERATVPATRVAGFRVVTSERVPADTVWLVSGKQVERVK